MLLYIHVTRHHALDTPSPFASNMLPSSRVPSSTPSLLGAETGVLLQRALTAPIEAHLLALQDGGRHSAHAPHISTTGAGEVVRRASGPVPMAGLAEVALRVQRPLRHLWQPVLLKQTRLLHWGLVMKERPEGGAGGEGLRVILAHVLGRGDGREEATVLHHHEALRSAHLADHIRVLLHPPAVARALLLQERAEVVVVAGGVLVGNLVQLLLEQLHGEGGVGHLPEHLSLRLRVRHVALLRHLIRQVLCQLLLGPLALHRHLLRFRVAEPPRVGARLNRLPQRLEAVKEDVREGLHGGAPPLRVEHQHPLQQVHRLLSAGVEAAVQGGRRAR
mmetsp:Transcript_8053/g.16497  ORF Transcript_8053/g.16497 Transcript_8053/m.16497 type:complete len:333 (+) Transcript_8053:116-1114(+)